MPRYRDPPHIPTGAYGYDRSVMAAAGQLVTARGPAIMAALDAVVNDGPIGDEDRAFFRGLAAAARQVLVANQIAPAGFRVHRDPFEDDRSPTGSNDVDGQGNKGSRE